jgi:hypothetical protein
VAKSGRTHRRGRVLGVIVLDVGGVRVLGSKDFAGAPSSRSLRGWDLRFASVQGL